MAETHARVHAPREAEEKGSYLERLARKGFHRLLEGLGEGTLVVREGSDVRRFGRGAPEAEVRIHDAEVWRKALWGGDVALGDSYMEGKWTSPDLVAVMRLAVRNMAVFDAAGGWLSRLVDRLRHGKRRNTVAGSRRNIGAHYDLGNEFYGLFLDPTLAYSCAVFAREGEGLEEAQRRKFDGICRKLRIGAGHHVLEIGTGWGGFAAHAAENYGCRVTTTTISKEQHAYAKDLFSNKNIGDRVTLLAEDYRNLRGQFDRIVSIEMFEAVGLRYYDDYFRAIDRLLAPEGAALVQTITMNERAFPGYIRRPDWIQKRIFPGAELASLSEILKSLGRATRLSLFHMEDIGTHYARTLRAWRERFMTRLDDVRRLGFDENFIRMWEYYLAYCEGAFAERYIGDAQLLFARTGTSAPLGAEPW